MPLTLKKNNLEEASKHFEQGLQYYPNALLPLFHQGTIYVLKFQKELESKQPDSKQLDEFESKANYWYDRLFKIRSDYEKAWNNIGILNEKKAYRLKKEGNSKESEIALQKAEQCYDKAIRLNKLYFEATTNKASLYLQTNRNQEAISLLLEVLKITADKYDANEIKLKSILGKPQNTINAVTNDRFVFRQDFIKVTVKTIDILKRQLLKAENYQGYLQALEFDFKLRKLQIEEEQEQLTIASNELELAKKEDKQIRSGLTLERLETRFHSKKDSYEKVKQVTDIGMAKAHLEKGEILRLLNQYDNAITVYKSIEKLESPFVSEQKSMALLKINEIYINIAGTQLPTYYNEIEANFKNATFKDNPTMNESKANLMKAYNDLKNK